MESAARRDTGRFGLWPDLALAVVITTGGQFELAFSGESGWHGVSHSMALLAQTVPVAARRVFTASAAMVGAIALTIEAVWTGATNTLSGLVAGLVLVYSVGRWLRGRELVAISTVLAAALTVHMLQLPGVEVDDLLFALIFSAAAWLAGRTMRRREEEQRRAADRLRAEKDAAARALQTAVADERIRIARELHDVVAHGMGAMVVQAAAAEQMLEVDPLAARLPLTSVRQTGQGALAEMRRLLGLLRAGDDPDAADPASPQPGLSQIPALIDRLRAGGMHVELSIAGEVAAIPEGLQVCAYRIVQEALTNSLKHAAGAATTVTLNDAGERLDLVVHTAPGAHAPGVSGAGHGLIGMAERVRVYGGSLDVGPLPDGSFRVHAQFPVVR
ncbi:MAG TPA: histidine kinase [Marmoricola sp.]